MFVLFPSSIFLETITLTRLIPLYTASLDSLIIEIMPLLESDSLFSLPISPLCIDLSLSLSFFVLVIGLVDTYHIDIFCLCTCCL